MAGVRDAAQFGMRQAGLHGNRAGQRADVVVFTVQQQRGHHRQGRPCC